MLTLPAQASGQDREQGQGTAPTLTVYMGVPGSGKSTHAKDNARGVVLSADAIRNQGADAEQHMSALRQRTLSLLRAGKDVTVDACNVHAEPRRALLAIAAAVKARTRLVIIEATPSQAAQAQRGRAHPVPRHALRQYLMAWRGARASVALESWDEVVVIRR